MIFIAGNMPMMSEITPLLIISKLEQYDYAGATAMAVVMLVISFVLLLVINLPAGLAAAPRPESYGMSADHRQNRAAARRRAPARPSRLGALDADRHRAGLPGAVPGAAAGGGVHRGAAQGLRRLPRSAARSPMPGRRSG